MRPHRLQLFSFAPNPDPLQRLDRRNPEQKRKSHDMVQMGMGQQDFQLIGLQQRWQPENTRTRIEHNSRLGNGEARRVPCFVGVITRGARKWMRMQIPMCDARL